MDSEKILDNKGQPSAFRRSRVWIVITCAVLVGLLIFGEIAFRALKSRGWTSYTPANSGLVNDRVTAVAFDGQGRVWVGTYGGLSVLYPDGGWGKYTRSSSRLADNRVNAVIIDGQGRVWVGTYGGLSVLAPDGSWTTYTSANSGLVSYNVLALAIDRQGRVWVGTSGSGLSVLAPDGSWTTYTSTNSGLTYNFVNSVAIDGQGWVWVGTSRGLSVLAPGISWTTYRTARPATGYDKVYAVAFDGQGWAWVVTSGGLSVLDLDGNWTNYTTANSGLAFSAVRAMAIDAQGRAWVGAIGGLGILDPEAALNPGFIASFASLRLYLRYIAILASIGLAIYWVVQRRRLRPKKVAAPSPVLQPAPIEAAMLETGSKGDQIRGQREMDSDNLNQLKMRRIEESARGVYRWLWRSALLTVPTLAFLLIADVTISIAVLGSALWHLLLLRQALAKHPYVRWHGRQGLLLAGLRTAVPLLLGLSYQEDSMLPWFWLLAFIWLASNIWGHNQVVRGDCWLMRVFGQGEGLPLKWPGKTSVKPQPSVERGEVLLTEGQRQAAVSELLAAFRSGDSGIRGKALEQLKSMGEVEDF